MANKLTPDKARPRAEHPDKVLLYYFAFMLFGVVVAWVVGIVVR